MSLDGGWEEVVKLLRAAADCCPRLGVLFLQLQDAFHCCA